MAQAAEAGHCVLIKKHHRVNCLPFWVGPGPLWFSPRSFPSQFSCYVFKLHEGEKKYDSKVFCPKSQDPHTPEKEIRANPSLNFNLGSFFPLFESLLGITSSIFFRAFNYKFVDEKNYTEFSFKAFRCEIISHTNPGCINLALNNPALLNFQSRI